ncbi:hypothetical protein Leryth_015943 [Lithospermum erythrorhizon]|nr:hypothetical protein Leryth_015943 [Lithospermum erythrorhizon]
MVRIAEMMEQEIENLTKDKQELQEKFAEKSKQKRKLDEMYDQLRSEYESVKRGAIQPANNFFHRAEPDLFSNPANMMDNRDSMRKDRSILTPETPGQTEDMWQPKARQSGSDSGHFDIGGSPRKPSPGLHDIGNRRPGARPAFGAGSGVAAGGNPSMALRNLILSPIKRTQLSRSRPQLFTL